MEDERKEFISPPTISHFIYERPKYKSILVTYRCYMKQIHVL